jgi:hypothetical protein
MEAKCSSEMSVGLQRTTQRYIPEDRILLKRCCENPKSCLSLYIVLVHWSLEFWKSLQINSSCVPLAGWYCLVSVSCFDVFVTLANLSVVYIKPVRSAWKSFDAVRGRRWTLKLINKISFSATMICDYCQQGNFSRSSSEPSDFARIARHNKCSI